jgi:hypothetical protein
MSCLCGGDEAREARAERDRYREALEAIRELKGQRVPQVELAHAHVYYIVDAALSDQGDQG